eukprot:gene1135-666_t
MRLVTHNLLACLRCEQFPLDVTGDTLAIEYIPVEFDEAFARRMLGRVDYPIFLSGVAMFRYGFKATVSAHHPEGAPWEDVLVEHDHAQLTARDVAEMPLPPTYEALSTALTVTAPNTEAGSAFSTSDPDQQRLLLLLHTLLEGLAVRNGVLRCSACEAEFPVQDFIPSFLLYVFLCSSPPLHSILAYKEYICRAESFVFIVSLPTVPRWI